MPWAIWPSLVVLWGVCWMFVVPWNDANHLDAYLEDYLGAEQARPFPLHFSLNPDLAPIATRYDQFLDNLGNELVPNSVLCTNYPNYGMYNDVIGNQSEQDLPALVPSVGAVGLLADVGLDFGYSSNDRNRLENLDRAIIKVPIADSCAQIPLSPNQQEISYISNYDPAPQPPAAVTPGGSQLQFLGQLSRGSIIAPEQPESPPRNAEGNYICVGFGCSNEKIFEIRSKWQTHINQHTRPFICSVEGCYYRSATKGVLDRHKNRKHSNLHFASSELAGVAGTDRSGMFEVRELAPASAHGSLIVMDTDTDKGKAKRKFVDDEVEQEGNDHNEQSTGLRMVQKNVKLDGWGSTRHEEELAQENEMLRQELKKVHEELVTCRAERDEEKKERETLLGIFDRVTKQIK
ncbi:hypothetical protein EG329_008999 [Mollisiaceae sp. DMI_Dod_QoI]|nr:hypothetical protein EG329_008999 [Helotiales sp. DMI_Dod_QoI]